jgi:hypothetical protein
VTLPAVIHGTFTYRGSTITPHAGDQTDDAPAQPTPAIPAGEGRTNDGRAFPPGISGSILCLKATVGWCRGGESAALPESRTRGSSNDG